MQYDARRCSFAITESLLIITYSKDEVYEIPYDSKDRRGIDKAYKQYSKDRDKFRKR